MITLAMVMVLMPPPLYDYEPKTPYVIREFHEGNQPLIMELFCHPKEKRILLGCTINNKIIYIRDDIHGRIYDIVLRHEKAHINGYNHP